MKRILFAFAALLLAGSSAFTASAAETARPNELKGRVGPGPAAATTRVVQPLAVSSVAVAVVDDDWTGYAPGTPVTVGAGTYTIGSDAFATIQAGIDGISAGGTVLVLPGSYTETATNRYLYDASGPYQFGLFFAAGMGAVTVRGVDAGGVPVTGWSGVLATVTTNATNGFGPSGVFVEGDGVTLQGLRIGTNLPGVNKTLEVIGDAFTLRDCDLADLGGSVYINDFRYDAGTNTSHVKAYRIEGCRFQDGLSLDLASGAGYSGPVSGRVVTGNEFHNGAGDYWPSLSFNGSGTGVPWFLYSVGGAVITGNTFVNAYPQGQAIRARGTYDNTQFDWATYFAANAFDRAVVVGAAPPGDPRTYSYVSGPYTMSNVRRIGCDIQGEIDHALAGDVVLVKGGTYVPAATLTTPVANLTLKGSGAGSTVVRTASAIGHALSVTQPGFTLRDLTLEKTDLANQNLVLVNASGCTIRDAEFFGPDPGAPWSVAGHVSRALEVSGSATGLLVQGNSIHHLRQPAYLNPGAAGSIVSNVVAGTRGWVVDGATLAFTGNAWGSPPNQGADIALLASCTPAQYPDLLALSSGNGNAYISGQFAGASSGRAHAYVDAAAAPGGDGSAALPYTTVQAGVNGTLAGGLVSVAAGTYVEQVVVDGKNLTVTGAGRTLTTIQSPVSLPVSFATPGNNNFPIVLAKGAADIRLSDVTVDGAGRGNGNFRFQGVAFYNAGGKLLRTDVKRIEDTPFSGSQHGVGVYAYNTTGGPYALEVGDVTIRDFQKNATVFAGTGLTATVHDVSVAGKGNTAVTAQNGFQVSGGASATLTDCSVSGIFYTPASVVGCALLAFGPGSVDVTRYAVTDCQFGAYYYDAGGSLAEVSVGGNSAGVTNYGIGLYNSSSTAANAATPARAEGGRTVPEAAPFDAGVAAGRGTAALATTSLLTHAVTGGCLVGADVAGSIGLDVWSAGGGLAVTASGLEIQDWDYGISAYGPGVSSTAHHNRVTSNVTAGYDGDVAAALHLAELNWWGAASGPSGAGPGSGDAVLGASVDFSPWLTSGADANPGCGFTAGPDNVIAAGPAPSCISVGNPCITIPVTIARTTSDAMRGFSVTVQLSSNLALCGAQVAQGSYLSSVGGTNFQVVANGGGSYTIDCAILGLPCGATAPSGTLFTLDLAKAPGPDGAGTVTIGPVLARDCANAPVAVSAGAPLSITIDTAAPSALANLAAAQKKTGNAPGDRTAITLTFTPPSGATAIEVYRAPFGQYPEYDDAGGAAPAAPAYPPAAPWTLTAVTASGQTDTPPARDFWYYVAFAKDACGNVSPVSNRTGGTLDYHLGDVSNGLVAGTGDDRVNTADISLLGAHYGITLAPADTWNFLDVGPTTDYSVNARPTTDNRVNFEDLMMFAINHGQVSAPQDAPVAAAAGADAFGLQAPEAVAAGATFAVSVRLRGAGDIQGASVRLRWDAARVEPVAVEAGELTRQQGREALLLSPGPGTVDVALLGPGAGFRGEGELARVVFQAKAAGAPGIALDAVTARDAANRPVGTGTPGAVVGPPARTELGPAFPNPARGGTALQLSLAREARVRVAVFDLVGRRVRTLADGVQPAGRTLLTWDGRDDAGRALGAGLYLVRFDGDAVSQTRRVMLTP